MKKNITIGVAGHVDHGKTSLVRCLTGIDTDRMGAEKRRGLSIEAGIAPLTLPSGDRAALVDVPGHTDFIKNTIRGLSGVDLAVLVVAVDDGVMPQTIEHLKMLDQFGVKGGIAVLTKTDLGDDDIIELAELELSELLENTFLEGKPVLKFSATASDPADDILAALEAEMDAIDGKNDRLPFRMWVDQVKGFPGIGTVVSGTVLSGRLKKDEPLMLFPEGLKTRARSLESHQEKLDCAEAGQRIGLNLHRISLRQVRRGMLLTVPEGAETGTLLNAVLRLFDHADPLADRQKIKLYVGAFLITATVILMEKEMLLPGEKGLVQFRTDRPVPAFPRSPVVITPMNRPTVSGGGQILEITGMKFRPAKAERIVPYLKALESRNSSKIIDARMARSPHEPLSAAFLSRLSGLESTGFEKEIQKRLDQGELADINGVGLIHCRWRDEISRKIHGILTRLLKDDPLKQAVKPGELKDKLPGTVSTALLQHLLDQMCAGGVLTKGENGYRIPDLAVSLNTKQEKSALHLLAFAQNAGIMPFSAHTAWKERKNGISKQETERILNYLYHQGQLIRLNNERYIDPDGLSVIKEKVKQTISEKGALTIADAKELLGYGRWGSIPVLEHLDEIGFTVRRGNERVMAEP